MPLEKISQVCGSAVYVPGDDIDTDRIIPARFMKCLTFDGLGEYLFYDMKFHENGDQKEHPLNDPRYQNASVMVTGMNFGCGSSREHAPQSLYRAGFRAVIAGILQKSFSVIQSILVCPAFLYQMTKETLLQHGSIKIQVGGSW